MRIFTIVDDNFTTRIITDTVLFYCDNLDDDYSEKILIVSNTDVQLSGKTFDNTINVFEGYIGNNIPNNSTNIQKFYLDYSSFKLYQYINSWKEAITCLSNYKFIDLSNNIELDIYVDNNIIYNTNGDKYMYNGNYQSYYSGVDNITIFTQESILNELEIVKHGKALIGDFLLIKINDEPKIYRINSLNPLNITNINVPNKYLFYNLTNVNILLVNNNDITITNLIFNVNIKVFQGYMEGIKNKDLSPIYNYYIDIQNNLFQTFYNSEWIYTFLGLYVYNFSVNPFYKIENRFINNSSNLSSYINVNSVSDEFPFENIPNSINFNGDILTYLPESYTNNNIVCVNNEIEKCGIFQYIEAINKWAYYNPSPIIKFNDQYIYNCGNDFYFITNDTKFIGKIINDNNFIEQEINDISEFGSIILLMDDDNENNGKIYELTYNDDNINSPYVWKLLCSEQSYFTDVLNNMNYIVNDVDNIVDDSSLSYIVERASTNYFVGELIILSDDNIFVDDKYYSILDIDNYTGDNLYIIGNICLYKNNKLNIILKDNEPYTIYDIVNNIETVYNGAYYGLKKYSGYSEKVNDFNNPSSLSYKNCYLIYNDVDLGINTLVKIYLKNNIVKLLDKTYYNDLSTGKMYIIDITDDYNIGKIVEIVKSKLNNSVIDSLLNDSNNLFKYNTRFIKQNLSINTKGYIKFDIQPPLNSKTDNILVKKENNIWYFDCDNTSKINFTFNKDDSNYELIYFIYKQTESNKILYSIQFTGEFTSNDLDGSGKYILLNNNFYINNLFNINYLINGVIKIPESGLYSISAIINYNYPSNNSNTNIPYYSLNKNSVEIVKNGVSIISINNLYSIITNGIVELNIINNFDVNDELTLVYNLEGYQNNVVYKTSYLNISKLN